MSFESRMAAIGRAIDDSLGKPHARARAGVGLCTLLCLTVFAAWRWGISGSAKARAVDVEALHKAAVARDARAPGLEAPRPMRADTARPNSGGRPGR